MLRAWSCLLLLAGCSDQPIAARSQSLLPASFLVKDINPSPRPTPNVSSRAALGGTLFFNLDAEDLENQLWKSDGTTAGSQMVANFADAPGWMTSFDGEIFFAADDGSGLGREVWRTDGTPGGTALFKDVLFGGGSSSPSAFIKVGTTLFFAAGNGIGQELWKSDGSPLGTVKVADLPGGFDQSTAVGNTLFFRIGNDLWKSNGTEGGTGVVASFASSVYWLTAVGSTLFFTANDGTHGNELWKSDGTTTVMVRDIQDPGDSDPGYLTAVGDTLFFAATNADDRELWKSDGDTNGTVLVKDLNTVADGLDTGADLTAFNGLVYFIGLASSNNTKTQLWSSDGTANNTLELKAVNSGVWDMIAKVDTTLFFTADDGAGNTILWKSDGVDLTPVADLFPGVPDTCVIWHQAESQRLFLYASDCSSQSLLFVTDGTAEGTHPVTLPLNRGADSRPYLGVELGSLLLFVANDGSSGQELWRSDGTANGTVRVKDIYPGPGDSEPDALTVVGDYVYFNARDDVHGTALWRSDGTEDGTTFVHDVEAQGPVAFGGALYFAGVVDPAYGLELWKSNGSEVGTVRIEDLWPGIENGSPGLLTVVGDSLYFFANDGTNDWQLWKTDGSPGGAVRLTTVPGGLDASHQTVVGNALYFLESGSDLWRSDGVTTALVKHVAEAKELTNVAGTLFFAANDNELWKSDGTDAGTLLVKTVPQGYLSYLTATGSTLYFITYSDGYGEELWKSDGTDAGTVLVRDIYPGLNDSSPSELYPVGNLLFFSATDGTTGEEPWITGGTLSTTLLLHDLVPGPGRSHAEQFTRAGGYVYFNAWRADVGEELWAVPINSADPVPPVLTCPAAVATTLTSASGAIVDYAAANAVDNLTSTPVVSYSQASGTEFPLGDTIVTVTATDVAGNTSSCSFTITVAEPPDLSLVPDLSSSAPDLSSSSPPDGGGAAEDLAAPDLGPVGADEGGCGCAVGARAPLGGPLTWFLALLLLLGRLRFNRG